MVSLWKFVTAALSSSLYSHAPLWVLPLSCSPSAQTNRLSFRIIQHQLSMAIAPSGNVLLLQHRGLCRLWGHLRSYTRRISSSSTSSNCGVHKAISHVSTPNPHFLHDILYFLKYSLIIKCNLEVGLLQSWLEHTKTPELLGQ